MPNGERPNAAEPSHSDVDENEADYIITRDESNHADRAEQQIIAVYPKSQEKSLPITADELKNNGIISERNLTNESDAQKSPKRGDDIIVPEIS